MIVMLKNPIFWGAVLFLGGMVVGGIGWDKYDSTLESRAHGSISLIAIGVAMIITGALIFFTKGNKR